MIKDKIIEWVIIKYLKRKVKKMGLGKVVNWLQGKKLYITGIALGIVAYCEYVGIKIPNYIWTILTSFGVIAGKSALQKLEK